LSFYSNSYYSKTDCKTHSSVAARRWREDIAQSHYTPEHALFRKLLREARLKAGLSQEQLGQRVGLSQLLVSRSESGDRKIDVLELRAMCRAMDVPFVELMQNVDSALEDLEQTKYSSHLPHHELSTTATTQPERTRRTGPRKPATKRFLSK
jgi:transcriptional regulator with XRE-family HTH domain